MHRPISQDLLLKAAWRIYDIAALYNHFRSFGWLSSAEAVMTLLCQSACYLTMDQGRGPIGPADTFRQSPFLPLDILNEVSKKPLMCGDCRRRLF
jgi:hypothetical protein